MEKRLKKECLPYVYILFYKRLKEEVKKLQKKKEKTINKGEFKGFKKIKEEEDDESEKLLESIDKMEAV